MQGTAVIIDDSRFLITRIAEFFERDLGLTVLATGHDGSDAVELYRTHRPDLLSLDITMPRKSGRAALREILEEFPDAHVMIISALRGDTVLECMNMGARGYVEKPIKFDDPEFMEDFRISVREAMSD